MASLSTFQIASARRQGMYPHTGFYLNLSATEISSKTFVFCVLWSLVFFMMSNLLNKIFLILKLASFYIYVSLYKLLNKIFLIFKLQSASQETIMAYLKVPDLLEDLQSPTPDSLNLHQSYNERIRPLLDAVDTLRNLGVVKEGIRLPTIVVIGDQSSGKSSVLESLAGISLPTGQGICTRVPLIMRLQNCNPQECEIVIEYNGKKKKILETEIKETLDTVTEEIAGSDKGISDKPVTLHVKKTEAPDLTMVDLPGITRVPVHGQPRGIYEQITNIIKQYITPKESIILNVLSATVDFPTCESIKMSQDVDEHGERTLAVVTKVDRAPEGLLQKVTRDAVNIGHGYVCVRNRIGTESNAEARRREGELFRTNPHLSGIDKSMVGIPMLAEKLMQIQATGIRNCLPDIVRKIDYTLSKRLSELAALPRHFSSSADAMLEFLKAMDSIKGMLNRIIILGDFVDFEDEPDMHCTAYLNRMFMAYSHDLLKASTVPGEIFLSEEILLLQEAQGITLPNFLPHPALVSLMKNHIDSISETSRDLAIHVCDYLDKIICRVIDLQTKSYPKLHLVSRRAFQALIGRKKADCIKYVEDMMEMEKCIVLTMSPNYSDSLFKLQEKKTEFMTALRDNSGTLYIEGVGEIEMDNPRTICIEGIGEIKLDKIPKISSCQLNAAFELKVSLLAYWNVVRLRLADQIPLHLRFISKKLVQNDIIAEIVKEVGAPGLNMMEYVLEESPVIAIKRKNLNNSVERLRQSKSALSNLFASAQKPNINDA